MSNNFNIIYKISNFDNIGIDKGYIKKDLKNVWFLENPIDLEYKYYILMDFLQTTEKNIDNGYLYKEYVKLNNIYADLQCFQTSYDIVNKSKESEKLINYIYNLPSTSKELQEIEAIVNKSLDLVSGTYNYVLGKITELYDNMKIEEVHIRDGRKPLNFFIQKGDFGIFEVFELKKSGLVIEKSPMYISEVTYPDNYMVIKSNFAFNSIGAILPMSIYDGED